MRVAFSGCGLLFPVHLGAYLALLTKDPTPLSSVAGTSGGSLIAAALSCFDLEVVQEIVADLSLEDSITYDPTAIFKKGYCYGKTIEKDLKFVFGDTTFADTRIPLYVTASDVVTGKPVVFSKERTPDMLVRTALRASIAIPIVFTPVLHEDSILVDGSVFDPTPVRAFPKSEERTYGIRIRSMPWQKHNGLNYVLKIASMLVSAVDHMYVDYDRLDEGSEMFFLDVPYSNYKTYGSSDMILEGFNAMRFKLRQQSPNI